MAEFGGISPSCLVVASSLTCESTSTFGDFAPLFSGRLQAAAGSTAGTRRG